MRQLILTTAIIFALLTAAGLLGTAQADPIYACYQKNHGQLRIVGNPGECLKSEIAIILGQSLDDMGTLIGEHCWDFSDTTNGVAVSGALRLDFSYIGNGHYLCSGIFNVIHPIVMKFPTFGNAEFVDGKIYLTLSVAGIRNGVMGNDMYKVVLNPSDLSGTVEGIGVYGEDSHAIVELTTGTVSNKTCP